MARVVSFSLADADLEALIDHGVGEHGGNRSAFFRSLLELYGTALATAEGRPRRDAFTAAYVEARVREDERQIAILKARKERNLRIAQAEREREDAIRASGLHPDALRSPEALVDAVWHTLPRAGEDRSKILTKLADEHGIDPRAVRRAAGKRHALEQSGQTNLRALPTARRPHARARGPPS